MSTVPAVPPIKYVLGYRSRTRTPNPITDPNPSQNIGRYQRYTLILNCEALANTVEGYIAATLTLKITKKTGVWRTGMSTLPAAIPIKYVLGYRSRTRTLTLNPNPNPKNNTKRHLNKIQHRVISKG